MDTRPDNPIEDAAEHNTRLLPALMDYRVAQILRDRSIARRVLLIGGRAIYVRDALIKRDVPAGAIALEETARTVEEGLRVLRALYGRHQSSADREIFPTNTPLPRVAVLAHYSAYKKTKDLIIRAGLPQEARPICAEYVLARFAHVYEHWVIKIMDYYRSLGMPDAGRKELHDRLLKIQFEAHGQ